MKTLTPKQLKRFQVCVALLDAVKPKWRSKINIFALNMHVFSQCVLGQIYGDYNKCASKFFQMYVLKFPSDRATDWPLNPSDSGAYRAAWVQEVKRHL